LLHCLLDYLRVLQAELLPTSTRRPLASLAVLLLVRLQASPRLASDLDDGMDRATYTPAPRFGAYNTQVTTFRRKRALHCTQGPVVGLEEP